MTMRMLALLALFLVSAVSATGDTDTSGCEYNARMPFVFSGYCETYYCHDLTDSRIQLRPAFLYAYNRCGEPNINLAFVRCAYSVNSFRASGAVMAGTYADANLASEPDAVRHIYEAKAGLRLSQHGNFWLDVGVMPSHIGAETPTGADNWTLTRSIVADNSPYYESGARMSYTTESGRWFLAAFLLNGWQRISWNRSGNPAAGTQATFVCGNRFSINYSTYFGSDSASGSPAFRQYHDIYAVWQFDSSVSMLVCFDAGIQQTVKGVHNCYAPVVIFRKKLNGGFCIAGRVEFFNDPHSVIISGKTRVAGYSVNADKTVMSRHLVRLEGRFLHYPGNTSKDAQDNLSIAASFAIHI